MTTPHQLIRRTLTGIIAITCLSLTVTGCGTADNSAEPQKPATTETQKTETKEQTPDPEPETTVQQVIDHAKQISGKFGDLCSYTVPGDRDSTYRYIGILNLQNDPELSNSDIALTTAIQESLHWTDDHTSDENQRQISKLDAAYQTWETALWKTMSKKLSSEANGLKQSLQVMNTDGTADSCKQAPSLADSMPDTTTETEAEYVALRDWRDQVVNQLNQCQADMAQRY